MRASEGGWRGDGTGLGHELRVPSQSRVLAQQRGTGVPPGDISGAATLLPRRGQSQSRDLLGFTD